MKKNFERKPKLDKNEDNEKEFDDVKVEHINDSCDEINTIECDLVTHNPTAKESKGNTPDIIPNEIEEICQDNHSEELQDSKEVFIDANTNDRVTKETVTDTIKDDNIRMSE